MVPAATAAHERGIVMRSRMGFWLMFVVAITVLGPNCTDPTSDGQLVIDIDRLALRPGVTQVSFTANQLLLFYNQPPIPPVHKDVDCNSGHVLTFAPQAVTLDLSRTGRTWVTTANAPPGNLHELWT